MTQDIELKWMRRVLAVAIIAVALILWLRGCKSDADHMNEVSIPEVKGHFEQSKPAPVPPPEKEYVTRWLTPEKQTDSVVTENPINIELFKKYSALKNDSIDNAKKRQMYADAVQQHQYNEVKEDDKIKITLSATTTGTLDRYAIDYVSKPQRQKETVCRMLAGMEAANNKQIDHFTVKANLMLQNRKGNLLSAGIDTDQNYYIGYSFSIFNIKK